MGSVITESCGWFPGPVIAVEVGLGDGSRTVELLEGLPVGSSLVVVTEGDPKALARRVSESDRYVRGEVSLLPRYGSLARGFAKLEPPPYVSLLVCGSAERGFGEELWSLAAPLMSREVAVVLCPASADRLRELAGAFGFEVAGERGALVRRVVRAGADGVPRDGYAGELADG